MKIAILGGGIGALTTAFALTEDPARRRDLEITLYQDGWLLGGKGASVRNRRHGDRIEEHGLHLWLGSYPNAFRILRRAYAELERPADHPLATWDKGFERVDEVGLFERTPEGHRPWRFRAPPNDELPGDHDAHPSPREMMVRALRMLLAQVTSGPTPGGSPSRAQNEIAGALESVLRRLGDVGRVGALGSAWLLLWSPDGGEASGLAALLDRTRRSLFASVEPELERDASLRRLWILVECQLVHMVGLLRDGLLEPDADYSVLDDEEYRAWMARHGATRWSLDSCITQAMYNFAFAEGGGGAGTTLLGLSRFLLAYRGSIFWRMTAGMGEVVIAPLYECLRRRGVRFRFFHRVLDLGLDGSRERVERVRIARQALVKGGGEYEPLVRIGGIECWPESPLEDQLEDGPALAARAAQLTPGAPIDLGVVDEIELRAGRDFDRVVLGISIGALPAITRELADASPRWAAMLEGIGTVPTIAMQLWTRAPVEEVGPHVGSSVLGTYEKPLETWANMSHVLGRESWGAGGPRGLHYLCGTVGDATTPIEPSDRGKEAWRLARAWLDAHGPGLLAGARAADGFDLDALHAPDESEGEERFRAQYVRINAAPSDRYVLSLPGTTKLRLAPDDSGFSNLVLAGDWTRTGFDVGCIEAAVMSGLMASRALVGQPTAIVGEVRRAPERTPAPPGRRYVEHAHELSLRPPYAMRGTQLFAYALPATRARLDALLERTFEGTAGSLRAASSRVFLVAAFAERAFSLDPEHQARGWGPEVDVALWIPVLRTRRGVPSLCWHMPYVFVDAIAPVVAGREVYGFPKTLAEIVREPERGMTLERMSVRVDVLHRFGSGAPVRRDVLIDVRSGPVVRRMPTPRGSGAQLLLHRQMRALEHPGVAALSEAVLADSRITALRSASLVQRDATIEFLDAASHPIIETLGLRATREGDRHLVRSSFGAEADFDFDVDVPRSAG